MELHFLAQLLITQASQEDSPAQPETLNDGEMRGVLCSLLGYPYRSIYNRLIISQFVIYMRFQNQELKYLSIVRIDPLYNHK